MSILSAPKSKIFGKIFEKRIKKNEKMEEYINHKIMDKLYEKFLNDTEKLISGEITKETFIKNTTKNMDSIDFFTMQRAIYSIKVMLLWNPIYTIKEIFNFKFKSKM